MKISEYQDKEMTDMLKRSKKIAEEVFGKDTEQETILKVCKMIHEMNEEANKRLIKGSNDNH